MTITSVCQWAIVITGLLTIWALGSKSGTMRKWGYITGIIGSPFWFTAGYLSSQWGLVILSVIYFIFYIRGLINHWEWPLINRNG